MDINIIKGESKNLTDCKTALLKSELGRKYFSNEADAVKSLNEGISKGEIFIAENKASECIGFIWIIPEGAFHCFPYLHIIAVKEEFRNLGIGKRLLKYFEDTVSEKSAKLFLVVADFNPAAKRLYESIGYCQVGIIPGLYRKGITEYLMMKEI